MSPVAVSADRRFHRAHVKPARRRALRWTLVVTAAKVAVCMGVVAWALLRGATFVADMPLLRVTRIETSGNQRMSADEIRAMLSGMRGENILFADLDGWRAKLLDAPWVLNASLGRSLPSTVTVVVQERTPMAIGRIAGQLYLIDERGRAIDEYGPQYGNLDLPIVDGFAGRQGKAPDDEARGALAARLITALRQKPAVSKRLSQVDVSDLHNATILLNDDRAELRVGEDHFLERVESYLSLSSTLRGRVSDIDYVDLRFDGRVYVRPVGKVGKTAATAGRAPITRPNDGTER